MTIVRELQPTAFDVFIPGQPCTYWSNGHHIIAEEHCRCGKTFMLAEKEAVE